MLLAWPTVLTMLSYTLMQFVDSIMVAQVGADEFAAAGNGGVWSFVPMAFLFGVLTVVNTFVSQALGAKRPHEIARFGWAGMWFAGLCWLLLMVPFGFALPSIFGMMGHSQRVTELESAYGQILVFGAVVTLVGKALSNFFFGLHRPKVIALAAITGNVVNLICSYSLIFGEAGYAGLGVPGIPGSPQLGLMGAAWGTLLGTATETLIPLAVFFGKKLDAEYGMRAAWKPDVKAIMQMLRVGAPAGLAPGSEIFCWAIFMSWIVGHFGTDAMNAGWATLRYMHLAFMPAVGFSVATTSLVGRYIGAGQPDVAAQRVRLAITVSMSYMAAWGCAMLFLREPMLQVFVPSRDAAHAASILAMGGSIMIAAAIFQVFDALGIILIGALRGAGDTLWPGMVTVVLSWTLVVGGGWAFVTLAPQVGPVGPWIAAGVYIAVFGGFMLWRWTSGKWREIRLIDRVAADAALVAPLEGGVPGLQANMAVEDIVEGMHRSDK